MSVQLIAVFLILLILNWDVRISRQRGYVTTRGQFVLTFVAGALFLFLAATV